MASAEAMAPMVTSATGNASRARGMTLLELLVGLVIVLAMTGAAVIAFPRSEAHRAELAASRAASLIALACERAELTGVDIGIAIEGRDLIFLEQRNGKWNAITSSAKEALRRRSMDPDIALELHVDAPNASVSADADSLGFCLADGEPTPFSIELHGPARQHWTVSADASGSLTRVNHDAHP